LGAPKCLAYRWHRQDEGSCGLFQRGGPCAGCAADRLEDPDAVLQLDCDQLPASRWSGGDGPDGQSGLRLSPGFLVRGERAIVGSITRSPDENERTLDFSALTGARPRIETKPLTDANQAYQRMLSGDVKFRMVLTMRESNDADQ
jgi:hypothetical protein